VLLPLKDLNPTERFPIMTIAIIVVNALVFLYELTLGSGVSRFVAAYGAIPYEITHFADLVGPDPRTSIVHVKGPAVPGLTLFTSMFIHGGFLHIFGNMLYLWIFGNNIEDILGPVRFLVFYLVCGLAAAFANIIPSPSSTVPMIGASGAIAGVLGAYLVAFPGARIVTFVFLFIFIRIMVLPAGIVLAFWFVIQLFSGFAGLSTGVGGGVAWFAHIGGFLAGIILIRLMAGIRPQWHLPGGASSA